MAQILDGKKVRDGIIETLKEKLVKDTARFSSVPTLAILQVGDRADSQAYIRQKKFFAEKIGVKIIHTIFPETVTQEEIEAKMKEYNDDAAIHGILLQIPLPKHLDATALIEEILPEKDVDGLGSKNTHALWIGKPLHMPATARGIITLLEYYNISLSGKNVCVIGKSTLVGKPIALALMAKEATVTICHKHTKNLKEHTKRADIIIVAIGDPEFITADYVSPAQVIIDVGINSVEKDGSKKLVGDVDEKSVGPIVAAITPVPGGVGPMTVASLFENLYDAYLAAYV